MCSRFLNKHFSRKDAKAQRKPLGARQALRLCAFAGEILFHSLTISLISFGNSLGGASPISYVA
jgi:hypothetical protein